MRSRGFLIECRLHDSLTDRIIPPAGFLRTMASEACIVNVLPSPESVWKRSSDLVPCGECPSCGSGRQRAAHPFGSECVHHPAEVVAEHMQAHLSAHGTGKMGPTLIGNDVAYPQVKTDPAMFAIIYGGASGAMQSFFRRGMQQDQMLKIIAYVRSLEK